MIIEDGDVCPPHRHLHCAHPGPFLCPFLPLGSSSTLRYHSSSPVLTCCSSSSTMPTCSARALPRRRRRVLYTMIELARPTMNKNVALTEAPEHVSIIPIQAMDKPLPMIPPMSLAEPSLPAMSVLIAMATFCVLHQYCADGCRRRVDIQLR